MKDTEYNILKRLNLPRGEDPVDIATEFKKTVGLVIRAIASADIAGLTRSEHEIQGFANHMEPNFLDLRESIFVRWEQGDCDATLQVKFKTVPTSRAGFASYAVTCEIGWGKERYGVEDTYKALSIYKAIADLAAKIEFCTGGLPSIEFPIKEEA